MISIRKLCILKGNAGTFLELYGLDNQSILYSKAYSRFGSCVYPILAFTKVIIIKMISNIIIIEFPHAFRNF